MNFVYLYFGRAETYCPIPIVRSDLFARIFSNFKCVLLPVLEHTLPVLEHTLPVLEHREHVPMSMLINHLSCPHSSSYEFKHCGMPHAHAVQQGLIHLASSLWHATRVGFLKSLQQAGRRFK
jgi:hypothetical protein